MTPDVLVAPDANRVQIWLQDAEHVVLPNQTLDFRRVVLTRDEAQQLWEDLNDVITSIDESGEIAKPQPEDQYLAHFAEKAS